MSRFTESLPGGRRLRDGRYIYWWVEILAVAIFYFVYSTVRNTTAKAGDLEAFRHARQVIHFERILGLYHEETLQDWALHFKPLIIASNYFYGSLHFVVTIFAAVYLFRAFSDEYPLYRNTLGVATGLALIGFATYPLMPPRLLPDHYSFVDTLARYPTFWSFNSGAVSRISNQFAAMPSVHCAWAGWCALVLAPRVKHTWQKALAIAYPFFTMTVIVLTANHYIVDAFGGFAVLGIAFLIASLATRAGRGEAVAVPSDLRAA
jgi:PAP2 superfamily protein